MFKEGKYWKMSFAFIVEAWAIEGIAIKTAKTIDLTVYAPDTGDRPGPNSTKVISAVVDENTVTEGV